MRNADCFQKPIHFCSLNPQSEICNPQLLIMSLAGLRQPEVLQYTRLMLLLEGLVYFLDWIGTEKFQPSV